MGFRTRTAVGLATALAGLMMIATPAAFASPAEFPQSTNEINTPLLPHVTQVSTGPGTVTLRFVNETNSLAYFEYRIDGVVVTGDPHEYLLGDEIEYPGVCVDGRVNPVCAAGPVEWTFNANEKVEIRFALGGENDWFFDWTEFTVGSKPTTKNDCKRGGWMTFGFRNQGECIRFVNTATR
jgi:hypothetical protein